jgi:hypothetical protein
LKTKKIVFSSAVALAAILAVIFIALNLDIKRPGDYYSAQSDNIASGSKTVFISIRCDTVLNNMDQLTEELKTGDYIPKDGVILPKLEFSFKEGDNVFSLLLASTKAKKIQMEFQGSPDVGTGVVYIKGISHLYEYSCGPLSGWLFKINGKFSSGDATDYQLKDKDYVEWVYTCDLGRDVGNDFGSGELSQ